MMNPRTVMRKQLMIWTLNLGILPGLAGNTMASSEAATDKADVLRFDAIVELNAPLCRTHIVMFARYWVSPTTYRMALTWAEPHSSGFNFPIYAPTLNVVSNPQSFRTEHQFKHSHDSVFPKPLGQRGPFLHKFNSYRVSDIRFAEQEALNLRIRGDDVQALNYASERTLEVSARGRDGESTQGLAKLHVRTKEGRLDELHLLDAEGGLLKSVQYEYADQEDGGWLSRQNVLLPERPIAVGFAGKKPRIRIAGKEHQYSTLETTHHDGGRKCTVDYKPIDIAGRKVPLPVHITVKQDNSDRVLRSAHLSNFAYSSLSADQIENSAEQFSFFTDNEMKCREMLVKYWLKDSTDVARADIRILEQLHKHFSEKPAAGRTIGEQLRHVNVLLQLDWMLGRKAGLERDFRQYLSLLTCGNLDRMILIGGQNAIELTVRWGQLDVAEKLLDTWLDAALPRNDAQATLEFAGNSLRKNRCWTTVKLMDRLLETSRLSPAQRFVALALRGMGRARVCEMIDHPEQIRKELDIAQAGWVSYQMSTEALERDLRQNILEAKESFAKLDQPTRDHKALRAQIEKINLEAQDAEDQ